MALRLTKTFNGYDFEYWKIISLNINDIKKRAIIKLGLYKDKDYRNNNPLDYVHIKTFNWAGNDFPYDFLKEGNDTYNVFKVAYDKIKEPIMKPVSLPRGIPPDSEEEVEMENVNEFSEAEDILENIS
ncbi:hypothetical protein K9M42_03110 [Patescibacteria group bacterium]|nr:hypothetical protein [Patescibacteria group bacterium]